MPTQQLSNTADQVNTTISCFYDRLVNNYIGPQNASQTATAGFLIQNGNKGQGICVANSGTVFFNNNLNFDPANTNLTINIPDTKNFIVTGNGAVMNFNGNGTLSIGQNIDLDYKGLQVFNSCPGLVLKDCDAANGFACGFIAILDSAGTCSLLIKTQFGGGGDILCGNSYSSWNNLDIKYDETFTFGGEQRIFLAKDNGVSFLAGKYIDPVSRFYVGSNMFVRSGFIASGITSCSSINSFSNENVQSGSGSFVGTLNVQRELGGTQYINFANTGTYVHSAITSRQTLDGASYLSFCTTPLGSYITNRATEAMCIAPDKKVAMRGDLCAYKSCFTSVKTDALCNLGSRTYLSSDANSFHWLATMGSINIPVAESVGGLGYGFSSSVGCVIEHRWMYNNLSNGALSTMLLSTASGLFVCQPITTCCSLRSSGSLNVSNINCCSCVCQRCISLFGYSATEPSISISGVTCFSGNANFNSNVKAATICATSIDSNSCIQGSLYSNILCVPSALLVNSTSINSALKITTVGLDSPSALVCARNFCQYVENATTNCFIEGLNVGASCNKVVNSKNTAKAWGTACIRNGWVVNNLEAASSYFHNVEYLSHWPNVGIGVYGIKLCNAIKAPFSASFSTRALSQFPWTTGSGAYNANDGFSNNGIAPFTAHLLTCAYSSTSNALQLITANSCYCVLYFTVSDNNSYETNWNCIVNNIAVGNLPFTVNTSSTVTFGTYSPARRLNYLKGAIDFSIYSQ